MYSFVVLVCVFLLFFFLFLFFYSFGSRIYVITTSICVCHWPKTFVVVDHTNKLWTFELCFTFLSSQVTLFNSILKSTTVHFLAVQPKHNPLRSVFWKCSAFSIHANSFKLTVRLPCLISNKLLIVLRRWARPWIFSHRYQIGWTVLMAIFCTCL